MELTGGVQLGCKVGRLHRVILYTFYRKPMSTKTPIMRRSAMPEGVVKATVSSEFIRRYKNVSRDLPSSKIEQVIEDYCSDLKRGGFTEGWIEDTLLTATKGYSKLIKLESEGRTKINRSGAAGKTSRRAKKLSKSSWFKSPKRQI